MNTLLKKCSNKNSSYWNSSITINLTQPDFNKLLKSRSTLISGQGVAASTSSYTKDYLRVFKNSVPSLGIFFSFCVVLFMSLGMTKGMAQVQKVVGGNMESASNWFVYNLGSATPATYTFNYTTTTPAQGAGGCLRITSATPTDILFWQKVKVKAGETYTVEGAIRTNNVASFWAEIYLSTVPPVEGTGYLPNGNADVMRGFSTWNGCGSNVNGKFSTNGCTGRQSYVIPGTAGTDVDMYYGFKTGSMANPLPNALEVLVDELKLNRAVATGNTITSLSLGTIQASSITIPNNVKVAQLKSSLTVSSNATYKVLNSSNVEVANSDVVTNTMKVVVTAENASAKTYTIATSATPIAVESFNNYTTSTTAFQNRIIQLNGTTNVTLTNAADPLKGSSLNLLSENVWIYFPNIKPSVVNSLYLPQILINGAAAVLDQNVRVEQYQMGAVVISHPSTYLPLQMYTGENLTGTSMQMGLYTYYRIAQLGSMNDAFKSFKLKKGYMATLAQDEMGGGASRVYVADNQDITINVLPTGLHNGVSFVRVFPWRWTAKKGWTSGVDAAQMLNCQWQYDWNNELTSNLDVEYVPMRHNQWWNSYDNINNKLKSTHALGFNEPDRTDQANISVETALGQWPEMLKSGLRIGSPAPSDAGAGLDWLFKFIDKCDSLKYRVDYVAVHWYKGGQNARQFYDWLKYINTRTKRTIWITEWNNGANWTCCTPTFASQATAINEMTNMLDTASFVERYSLYNWVGQTREMFYQYGTSLSPAGVIYRNNASPMAFNAAKAYVPSNARLAPAEFTSTENGGVSVYPNPVNDVIYLQTSKKFVQAALYTSNGKLVKTSGLTKYNTINVSHIPSGLYLLKLNDGKLIHTQKIIKQ